MHRASAGPPLRLECVAALSHVHGRMPVSRVYFAPSGAPVSAGRDGNIRTYALKPSPACSSHTEAASRRAVAAVPFDSKAADSAMPLQVTTAGSLEARSEPDAVPSVIANGTANGHSEHDPKPRKARLQLLTCVAVEAVPGMTAPVLEVVTAGARGVEERLVGGFQARRFAHCRSAEIGPHPDTENLLSHPGLQLSLNLRRILLSSPNCTALPGFRTSLDHPARVQPDIAACCAGGQLRAAEHDRWLRASAAALRQPAPPARLPRLSCRRLHLRLPSGRSDPLLQVRTLLAPCWTHCSTTGT